MAVSVPRRDGVRQEAVNPFEAPARPPKRRIGRLRRTVRSWRRPSHDLATEVRRQLALHVIAAWSAGVAVVAVTPLASYGRSWLTVTLAALGLAVGVVGMIAVWSGRPRRVLAIASGAGLILVGLVMLVTPGPGVVLLLAGLAALATEFVWARHLLEALRRRLADTWERVQRLRSVAAEEPAERPLSEAPRR